MGSARPGEYPRRLDDASGIDGEWSNEPSKAIDSLLHVVGSIYLPFLAANQAAKRANREEFEVVLADHPFRARPFGYQVKCLEALRNGFQRLPEPSRRHIAPLLEAHNCLAILSA